MTPFQLVYADPAWAYRNVKTGGSHTSGAAQQYPVMSIEELCRMPVYEIVDTHAVLGLWATTPLGAAPYEVMDAWGFKFKTKLYWHKTGRLGTGYWLRGEVEELLIGTRGQVKAWRSATRNWIDYEELDEAGFAGKPGGHSRKPFEVAALFEDLNPELTSCAELFATNHSSARTLRSGFRHEWSFYGLDFGHDFRDRAFWDSLRA